jgi:hypothetical protein
MRLDGRGELAVYSEARHHQHGRPVDAAGVGGKWLFLPGEICRGTGLGVPARPLGWKHPQGTRQKSADAVVPAGIGGREGLNIKREGQTVVLVAATVTAAIPLRRAWEGR